MKEVAFFAGAIGALGGAIAVIALRNAFYSVLALIVHLISLAGLFLLLQGEFLAAAQIVVYAGAVMVLYVFVAAYVGNVDEPLWEPIPGQRFIAPLLGLALFVELAIAIIGSGLQAIDTERPDGRPRLRLALGDRQAAAGALPDRLRGRVASAPGGGRRRSGPGRAATAAARPTPPRSPPDGHHLVPGALRAAVRRRRRRASCSAAAPW